MSTCLPSLLLHPHTLTLYSLPEFGTSEEAVLLQKMVDAYSQQDEEVLQECTADGIFRAMDPEVSYSEIISTFPRTLVHTTSKHVIKLPSLFCLKYIQWNLAIMYRHNVDTTVVVPNDVFAC